MECHSNGVSTAEVDDVSILEESLVDLLVVDIRSIRGIPVDQQNLAVDGNDLCVEPGDLRILQYDLTNRRLPPDPNARSAEPELLARRLADLTAARSREIGKVERTRTVALRFPQRAREQEAGLDQVEWQPGVGFAQSDRALEQRRRR